MEGFPYDINQILQDVTYFYGDYGILFQQAFWDKSKSLLIFRQTVPARDQIIKLTNTQELTKNLRRTMPSFSNDDIIFYPNGDVGIIIRSTSSEEKISELPIELYVNIVKNLDESSIDELCMTNKEFEVLCNNNKFWRRLLLIKFGEKSPQDTTYDYRKIYKGLLKAGGKNELYDHMSAMRELKDIEDLINFSNAIADAIIYVFNTDVTFKDKILVNQIRSSDLITILVLNGNLDKAQKLVDLYESLYREPPLRKAIRTVIASYSITHNYGIVDFIANNYPEVLNNSLSILQYHYKYKLLSKSDNPDLRKFLMDERIHFKLKNDLLISFAAVLTYDQFMNYLNLYRTDIDSDFLTKYLSLVVRGTDKLNKIKLMFNNYSYLMTCEDIRKLLSMVTIRPAGDLNEEELKIIRLLINSKQMIEKLGE